MIRTALVILVVSALLFGVHAFRSRSQERQTPLSGGALGALVQTAHIVPLRPTANNTLQVRMTGAAKADYQAIAVTWFRNGEEIEGYALAELTPEYFHKGDQLEADVRVKVPGPGESAEPVPTDVVLVANTPPRIVESSVNIDRDGSDFLYARVNAVDADDDLLEYSYTWYKNGVEVADAYGERFDLGQCQSGDRVQAHIVAWDGEVQSAVSRSEPIEVGSGAPIITSSPPQSLENRRFVYQVAAVAAGAGGLQFDLVKAPDGMTVTDEGLIDWPLPEATEGEHQFDVTVRVKNDTGGEAFQNFSIAVQGVRE